MDSLTISVNPKDLGVYEKNLAAKLRLGQKSALRKAANRAKTLLISASRKIVYTGAFRNGWVVTTTFDRLEIGNRAPNWIFVERGRRAGAPMPPVPIIRKWVIAHGMPKRAAFPVAKMISIRGIKARPVLENPIVQRQLADIVEEEILSYYTDALWESG